MYTCNICRQSFGSWAAIGGHLQKHIKHLKQNHWHRYVVEATEETLLMEREKLLASRKKRRERRVKQRVKVCHKEQSFYATDEWKALRYKVLKRYDGACQLCGRTRQDGIKLHVDHIKPRSRYPELSLEFSNLQVLCSDCNLGKSNRDCTDWRCDNE